MLSLYKQPDTIASSLAQTCMGVVSDLYSHYPFTPPPALPNSFTVLIQGKGGPDWYFYDVLVPCGSSTPGLK